MIDNEDADGAERNASPLDRPSPRTRDLALLSDKSRLRRIEQRLLMLEMRLFDLAKEVACDRPDLP